MLLLACFSASLSGLAFLIYTFIDEVFPAGLPSRVPNLMKRRLKPFRAARGAAVSRHSIQALSTARIMVLRRILGLLMLSLCLGQSTSPTTSPSPTPLPCAAPPGYFCSGGSALICPIGAYCAGGAALNVSCYPVTACSVAGLSAQPPCYWNVSTLAGSGSTTPFTNGPGVLATFSNPYGVAVDVSGAIFVADGLNHRIRVVSFSGLVSTLSGSGTATWADGTGPAASFFQPYGIATLPGSGIIYVADTKNQRIRKVLFSGSTTTFAGDGYGSGSFNGRCVDGLGTAASFFGPYGITVHSSGILYVADTFGNRIRKISSVGVVTTLAGSGSASFSNGVGVAASFSFPNGVAVDESGNVFVGDCDNHRIRVILSNGTVSTFAGSGLASWVDGTSTSASFKESRHLALAANGFMLVTESGNFRIRLISPLGQVSTIAGNGLSQVIDGFGTVSSFGNPFGISGSLAGTFFVADTSAARIRQITCVPCPAFFYCSSGAPVMCPAGSYCPVSSINATPCPIGSFSTAGAATCTLCLSGTFTPTTGSTFCRQCPGGHFCPAGTSSWARLNCGRGNYCPDGSGAPTPCPYQVPPSGGWGALQVQGPAFLVESAHCLNHCFWNFTSGDGMLSRC